MRPVTGAIALFLAVGGVGCNRPAAVPQPPTPDTAALSLPEAPQPFERILRRGTDEVAVLMYHDVVPRKDVWFDVTNREFEAQMAALERAGANVVPLADVVGHFRTGAPLPPRSVAITFDDNTLGIYENAFPILQRYGWHSTHFVHTAMVGVRTGKDHISWDQLREMEATGLADVESHTVSHPADLRSLSDEELLRQLEDSKAAIEAEMGHPARFLAYTEGNADDRVVEAAIAAGYEAAWGEQRAWTAAPADAFSLPRFAPFRMNDVVRRLASDSRSPHSILGPYSLRWSGEPTWQKATIAGRTGRLLKGIWPATFAPGDPDGVPCLRNVLTSDGFTKVEPNTQWDLYGKPMVVVSPGEVVITPYRHWLGESEQSPVRLLQGAELAAIGRDWLLPAPTGDAGDRRRLVRPAFCGGTRNGSVLVGQIDGSVPRQALLEALRKEGVVTAVLLRG